jgi:opacity protein-like surface antigen
MQKIISAALAVAVLCCAGTPAIAKTKSASSSSETSSAAGNFEVDGSFAFATGPGSFNNGYGFNVGGGYTLSSMDKNLQVRADLTIFDFSYDHYADRFDSRRIPLVIGARYYFPIVNRLSAFGQAGIETSFDKYDYLNGAVKDSKSEVNLGVSAGGGVSYQILPNLSAFALARVHMIKDSYWNMQFGAAFHF